MSYDLFVFDPTGVPRERAAFLEWFNHEVEDSECYFVGSSGPLKSWHDSTLIEWPDLQEVDEDQIDDPKVTGYSCTPNSIYVDFRWSVADEAYDAVRRRAVDCGVGFYDISGDEGDGEIYFPGDELREPSQGKWREVAADFRSGDLSKYIPQSEPPKRRWWDIFRRNK